MKINNINLFQAHKTFQSFRGDAVEFKPKKQETTKKEEEEKEASIQTAALKALFGIGESKYSFVSTGLLGENRTITIKNKDINKYFLKNGEVDLDLIQQFKTLYEEKLHSLEFKAQKDLRYYKSVLDEKPAFDKKPTTESEFTHIMLENFSNQEYGKEDDLGIKVTSELQGSYKKQLASRMIEFHEKDDKQIPKKAYSKTISLLEVSRSKDGKSYDFSNLKEKRAMVDKLDDVALNYAGHISKSEIYSQFIEGMRKEDDSLDFEILDEALFLLSKSAGVMRPKYAINLVKTFVSKDPSHKKEIFETIDRISQSYDIDEDKKEFEKLLSLCFDKDGNFSEKRQKVLYRLIDHVFDWIDAKDEENQQKDDIDIYLKKYFSYLNIGLDIIQGYFRSSTDENGDFRPTISAEDYVQEKIQKYITL